MKLRRGTTQSNVLCTLMMRGRDDLAKGRQFICWFSPQLTYLV